MRQVGNNHAVHDGVTAHDAAGWNLEAEDRVVGVGELVNELVSGAAAVEDALVGVLQDDHAGGFDTGIVGVHSGSDEVGDRHIGQKAAPFFYLEDGLFTLFPLRHGDASADHAGVHADIRKRLGQGERAAPDLAVLARLGRAQARMYFSRCSGVPFSMMVWNTNPLTQAPETDKIAKGLASEDLFLVVAEHFMSDTAAYADIILPAAMGAEMEDMVLSWGHLYLTYNEKCIEPPGEAIPNNEIFRRLAKLMGYTEDNFKWNDTECLENYVDWASPTCEGINLDYLRKHGFARLKAFGDKDVRARHAKGEFPTPTGKCHFLVEGAKNFVAGPFRQMYEGFQPLEDLDPLPDYLASRETPDTNPVLAAKYPLNIISPKSHGFLNSCYANVEEKIKGQGEQFVMINQLDATARNIKAGDVVRVFNDRGAFAGVARISEDVNAGIVVATLGYWRQLNNGTVNCISSAEFGDMGHSTTFSDNLVEVALR